MGVGGGQQSSFVKYRKGAVKQKECTNNDYIQFFNTLSW